MNAITIVSEPRREFCVFDQTKKMFTCKMIWRSKYVERNWNQRSEIESNERNRVEIRANE